MLGPNEIGLVGMDGVGGVRLPLTRFRTVRVQQAILPNAEKTHTLQSVGMLYIAPFSARYDVFNGL